jgi:hypothetical protein
MPMLYNFFMKSSIFCYIFIFFRKNCDLLARRKILIQRAVEIKKTENFA